MTLNLNLDKPRRRYHRFNDPTKRKSVIDGPGIFSRLVIPKILGFDDINNFFIGTHPTIQQNNITITVDPPIQLNSNEAIKVVYSASGFISISKIKKPFRKKIK